MKTIQELELAMQEYVKAGNPEAPWSDPWERHCALNYAEPFPGLRLEVYRDWDTEDQFILSLTFAGVSVSDKAAPEIYGDGESSLSNDLEILSGQLREKIEEIGADRVRDGIKGILSI